MPDPTPLATETDVAVLPKDLKEHNITVQGKGFGKRNMSVQPKAQETLLQEQTASSKFPAILPSPSNQEETDDEQDTGP